MILWVSMKSVHAEIIILLQKIESTVLCGDENNEQKRIGYFGESYAEVILILGLTIIKTPTGTEMS